MRQAAEPLGGNESTMSQYNTSQTPLPEPLPAADELSSPLARGGQRVGPYVLRSPMGEGPTGTLFHADHDDGSTAMVRLIPRSLSSRLAVEQFTLQQQALAALGSPHFVRKLFAGEEAGFFYVGCELLNGCDLHTALSLSGGIHRRKALEIARQICVGLELAHQAGIVHGALHPLNLYLATGRELTVKLLDFGAHALGARPDSLVILGDPAYLAPEQFGGTTARTSDVYTLAQLTFELLSGRRLVEATGATATAKKLGGKDPTAPQLFDPTLSALLSRSLSRDPAQRPPSVEAFRRALLAWAERSASVLDGAGSLDLPNLQKATAIPRQASVQTDLQAVRSQTSVQVNFSSQPMGNNMQSNGKAKDGAPPVAAASAGGTKPSSENESVEASLEEFINQANASFPTSDGWDLHTGDVELVDPEPNVEDDEELLAESDQTSVTSATELERKKAPRAAEDLDLDAPRRPSTTQSFGSGVTSAIAAKQAEAAATKAKTTSKAMPAVAAPTEPAPQPGQGKKTTSKAMPVATPAPEDELPPVPRKTTSKAMPAVQDDESAPKRPSRQMPIERTEVVAQPLPLPYQPPPPSWTTNPLVLIASMLIAFLVGAGGLSLMTRSNQQQPIVVSAPVAAPAPAPTPAAAAAPVVTPLPTTTPPPAATAPAATATAPAATAPVVTPLPTEAKPEQPAAAAPAEPDDKAAKMAAIRSKLAKSGSAKASKPEKKAAKASEPKAAKATKPAKEEKPAAAKKEAAPKKGGDWVDPF